MYFTWLSYPIVTLGIPLVLYVSLRAKIITNNKLWQNFCLLIKCSIDYVLGYVVAMIAKGALAQILGWESTAEARIKTLIGDSSIIERINIVKGRAIGGAGYFNGNISKMTVVVLFCIFGTFVNSWRR